MYFINDQFFYTAHSQFTKEIDIFVRENFAEQSDSIFQFQPSTTQNNFINVENANVNFRKIDPNKIFNFHFLKDPKSITFQRSVLTFLDC